MVVPSGLRRERSGILHVADTIEDDTVVVWILVISLTHLTVCDHTLCLWVDERVRDLVRVREDCRRDVEKHRG